MLIVYGGEIFHVNSGCGHIILEWLRGFCLVIRGVPFWCIMELIFVKYRADFSDLMGWPVYPNSRFQERLHLFWTFASIQEYQFFESLSLRKLAQFVLVVSRTFVAANLGWNVELRGFPLWMACGGRGHFLSMQCKHRWFHTGLLKAINNTDTSYRIKGKTNIKS